MTTRQRPLFVGAGIYRGSSYGHRHPLAIPRVPVVIDLCRALGWLIPDNYRTSPRAKPQTLTTFHTPTYISALQHAEDQQFVNDETCKRHGLGTLSNPVYPHMFRRPATSAGGVLMAAGLVAQGGCAFVPGGGTHHGMADRANGFCYLNDPVLGILHLRRLGARRIAYVDIDAHHCDGVEQALNGVEGIRIVSVHEENRWPLTGALTDTAQGIAFNLPVERNLNDTEFDMILDLFILPTVADFSPDVVVLQCGADALKEVPLSRLALSNRCHWRTVAALKSLARGFLVLGGGGYNPWAVGRCWSGVWATLSGFETPDRIPDDASHVLSRLRWNRQASKPLREHWITTLKDNPRPGPISDTLRTRITKLTSRLHAYQ